MSIFRRPTRAAGYSWRKWEDPIVYTGLLREARLLHLGFWVLLGVAMACLLILFDIPRGTADAWLFIAADVATVLLAWVDKTIPITRAGMK
jgi:Mrp family chromosome partitioning ATPase